MGKGYSRLSAFIETLDIGITSSFKFPVLELLVAVYTALALAMPTFMMPTPSASVQAKMLGVLSGASTLTGFVTSILVIKTVAYDIGVEIERNILMNYLSMPLKRLDVFTARLIASGGIPLLLYAFSQVIALLVKAPSEFFSGVGDAMIMIAANIGPVFFLIVLMLLFSFVVKKGSTALALAIVIWFSRSVAVGILSFIAFFSENWALIKLVYVLEPAAAVRNYYSTGAALPGLRVIETSFEEMVGFLVLHYLISVIILAGLIYYFVRRFEVK